MLLLAIIAFSLLGSAASLVGAGILLAFPLLFRRFEMPLIAYAIGAMLGATFLALLPEALEKAPARPVLTMALAGFIVFFVLERFLHGHHAHRQGEDDDHCRVPSVGRAAGMLVLIGDSVHNFVDGVLITAAFSVSMPLGILTSLAVFAHEIPQELGDFVVLLKSGFSPLRAYAYNFISSLSALVGALAAYWALDALRGIIPFILAFAAGNFLYISASDLTPTLHHDPSLKMTFKLLAGMLVGAGTLWALHHILGFEVEFFATLLSR